MAQPDAYPGGGIMVEVEIGAADGGALDRDDGAGRARQLRVGHVRDLDQTGAVEDSGAHPRTLARR